MCSPKMFPQNEKNYVQPKNVSQKMKKTKKFDVSKAFCWAGGFFGLCGSLRRHTRYLFMKVVNPKKAFLFKCSKI
jgi:hypothetical protein